MMLLVTSISKLFQGCYCKLNPFVIFRSEFGLLMAYFYFCDRTNLFGESKKVHSLHFVLGSIWCITDLRLCSLVIIGIHIMLSAFVLHCWGHAYVALCYSYPLTLSTVSSGYVLMSVGVKSELYERLEWLIFMCIVIYVQSLYVASPLSPPPLFQYISFSFLTLPSLIHLILLFGCRIIIEICSCSSTFYLSLLQLLHHSQYIRINHHSLENLFFIWIGIKLKNGKVGCRFVPLKFMHVRFVHFNSSMTYDGASLFGVLSSILSSFLYLPGRSYFWCITILLLMRFIMLFAFSLLHTYGWLDSETSPIITSARILA